jgi:hypothetical protein
MTIKRYTFSKAIGIGVASMLLWSGVAHAAPGGWVAVPELDPGLMASGLAFLVGGAALLLERYRR